MKKYRFKKLNIFRSIFVVIFALILGYFEYIYFKTYYFFEYDQRSLLFIIGIMLFTLNILGGYLVFYLLHKSYLFRNTFVFLLLFFVFLYIDEGTSFYTNNKIDCFWQKAAEETFLECERMDQSVIPISGYGSLLTFNQVFSQKIQSIIPIIYSVIFYIFSLFAFRNNLIRNK